MSVEKIPDVWLERYLLNELAPGKKQRVKQALASDPAVLQRLEELRRSNEELLREYPPDEVRTRISDRIQGEAGAKRRLGVSRLFLSPVGVALVSVTLISAFCLHYFWRVEQTSEVATEGVRLKGDQLRLLVFRKTAEGVEELRDGTKVAITDVIQLSYYSAEQKYGTILSLDGRGVITQHLPERGTQAAELIKGRTIPLPAAFQLDDAPRGEAFFFIAANQQFALQPVLDAMARESADWSQPKRRLALPARYQQSSVVLQKENR